MPDRVRPEADGRTDGRTLPAAGSNRPQIGVSPTFAKGFDQNALTRFSRIFRMLIRTRHGPNGRAFRVSVARKSISDSQPPPSRSGSAATDPGTRTRAS